MAEHDAQPAAEVQPAAEPQEESGPGAGDRFRAWFMAEGAWWAASFVFHMLLMGVMMVIGTKYSPKVEGETVSIEGADVDKNEPPVPPEKLEKFEVGETPLDPTELNTETLTLNTAPQIDASDAGGGGNMPEGGGTQIAASGPMLGGLGGFTISATGAGPAVRGRGGVGTGVGTGNSAGSGGGGHGFGGRGSGKGGLTGGFGGTKNSERAVAAALNWFARHQNANGSWSLHEFNKRCRASSDGTCSGQGTKADSAATAMSLLPFLAAGQTHSKPGPYRQTIYSGLYWLISNQKRDGDLRVGSNMYAHGLCAICLCEAYALSGDRVVGNAAQLSIDFIEKSQNTQTGGWRYVPLDPGDTSVVGWQVMALKSAQMAYLRVNQAVLDRAKKFVESCASGNYRGLYGYQPGGGATQSMTAVGLLCQQYLGMKRGAPQLREGSEFLMKNLPLPARRNLYYWYYATQVMHNVPGQDWDTWNRKMRRVLIDSQMKDGCAAGSWDPARPTKDPWGDQGGRIFTTSLATLTLEVYYRYLPLYKLDNESAIAQQGPSPAGGKSGDAAPTKEQGRSSLDAALKENSALPKAEGKPGEKAAPGEKAKPEKGPPAAADKGKPSEQAKPPEKAKSGATPAAEKGKASPKTKTPAAKADAK